MQMRVPYYNSAKEENCPIIIFANFTILVLFSFSWVCTEKREVRSYGLLFLPLYCTLLHHLGIHIFTLEVT